MFKYKYLYKNYLFRFITLFLFYLFIVFMQLGFKKTTNNFNELFLSKISDSFIFLQFVIPIFLINNFKEIKEEVYRSKYYLFDKLCRLIITFLICFMVRFIVLGIYCLIMFGNIHFMEVLWRVILVDIQTIVLLYFIYNIILNKYVCIVLCSIISLTMFLFKWMMYSILITQNDILVDVDYRYFASLGIVILAFTVSLYWRKEYVND